jgi:hypothetical protein
VISHLQLPRPVSEAPRKGRCADCDAEFPRNRPWQRYCSRVCRWRHWRHLRSAREPEVCVREESVVAGEFVLFDGWRY